MQKYLTLLEKHVQWIALGLGAIYLLLMIYGYVLQSPVSVKMGGDSVTLANVDKTTLEGPARKLEAKMNEKSSLQISAGKFSDQFAATLRRADEKPVELAGAWTTSNPEPINLNEPQTPGGDTHGPAGALAELPHLTAPKYIAKSQGRSTVSLPASTSAQPSNTTDNNADKQWVSLSFDIDTAAMAKAFKDAKIPEQLQSTYFLAVDLVREEQDEKGQWGNAVTVKPLSIHPLLPMPAANDWQGEVAYADWAAKNQSEIIQPVFYQVVKADPWFPPGFDLKKYQEENQPQQPFDPAHPPTNRKLTDEERKQVEQYRREEEKRKAEERKRRSQEQRNNRRPSGPGIPGGPGMPGPGGGRFAPRDPQRPGMPPMPPGYPGMPPGYPGMPGMPPGMPGMPGMTPGMNQPRQPLNPNLPPPPQIPTGPFNPAQQPTITVWTHDDSVQPGKTYRYKMRYAVKNPIYKVTPVAKNPKDADVFALYSDFSDFSQTISIPPLTNFFVKANFMNSPTVSFDVFTWSDGEEHKTTVKVGPGDEIGGVENNIDYSTGWTLVDVRQDVRGDTYVLLVDARGNLTRRDFRSDQANPHYQELQQAVEAAKVAAAN